MHIAVQAGLCALALLDPASEGFAGELDQVKAAAGRWARQPLRFSWINAARQARAVWVALCWCTYLS